MWKVGQGGCGCGECGVDDDMMIRGGIGVGEVKEGKSARTCGITCKLYAASS